MMHVERKVRRPALAAMAVTATAAIALGAAPAAMADDTPAPSSSDSPPVSAGAAGQGTSPDLTFNIRVKNYGAFLGYACFQDATPDFVCTGYIAPRSDGYVSHTFSSLSDPNGYTTISAGALAGARTTVKVAPGTHCFYFDGTTYAGFSFWEANCNGF